MAEHLTSEARARLADANTFFVDQEAVRQAPADNINAWALVNPLDLRALLAERDAAVAALREIAALRIRVNGAYPAALSIARACLARLEPEKTDAS